jgi:4-hydroxy-tetrahydrodipicolinate synthase
MFELKGIVPPVVTPLHADETIDEPALERQLERLITAGVHGLFFLGSNGEQPALRDSERARALRVAHRTVRGRVPLIVGTMASSTARAIENIRAAQEGGADAVAVTPPHYYPSRGPEDQLAHYSACAAAATVPVIVYNIPTTTKVMLSAETIARITASDRVIGVKDSSGDFTHVLKLIRLVAREQGKGVLVGVPPIAAAAILQGAHGSVPGIANMDPHTLIRLYEEASAGKLEALPPLQERVGRMMDLCALGAPMVCIKTALELMGICQAHATAPLQPLSAEKREAVAAILRELDLLPA